MTRSVLVTCGGGFQGETLINELLAASGFRVHVIDYHSECIGKYTAHHFEQAPAIADGKAYLAFVREYVERCGIEAVIPATPHDLVPLAEARDEFQRELSCHVAVSAPDLINCFLDKGLTFEWLGEQGFPVLETLDPTSLAQFLPVFGRARRGWGGKGSCVISEATELDDPEVASAFVWTRYLDSFREFSTDFCISFTGDLSPIIVRERLATVGGFAVVIRSAGARDRAVIEPLIGKLAERIAGEGGCGYFNVQVLVNEDFPDGLISDVNPRVGTSAVMARHQGIALAHHLFGRPAQDSDHAPRALLVTRSLGETVYPLIDASELEGLVLDLDDTLVSHRDWILGKARHVGETYGSAFIDEWMALVHRLVDEGQARRLYDELASHFSLDAVRDEMIAAHRAFLPARLTVYDDVEPALSRLRKSFRLILLSDNPAASQRQKLRRFPYLDGFDKVILTDELGTSKPDPIAFHAVCEATGLKPAQLAMVGDNFHRDVLGARTAGYGAQVHVRRPDRMFNTSAIAGENGATIVVEDLLQLAGLLEASVDARRQEVAPGAS